MDSKIGFIYPFVVTQNEITGGLMETQENDEHVIPRRMLFWVAVTTQTAKQ